MIDPNGNLLLFAIGIRITETESQKKKFGTQMIFHYCLQTKIYLFDQYRALKSKNLHLHEFIRFLPEFFIVFFFL